VIDVTVHNDIARPAPEVFAFVTDPDNLPAWRTNTVSVRREDDGPLAVGSRLREVHRGPGGRELASLVEVAELEPDRVFALRMLEGPLPIHARITFDATPDGTHVAFTAHGQPSGPMRLVQPLLRRVVRRQCAAHLAQLKRVMQQPGAPVP